MRAGGMQWQVRMDTMSSSQTKERNLLKEIGIWTMASATKGALALSCAIVIYSVFIFNETDYLSFTNKSVKLQIPSVLDPEARRKMSLNLGGGKCLWQVRCRRQACHQICLVVYELNRKCLPILASSL
jgi:hypothetical protein